MRLGYNCSPMRYAHTARFRLLRSELRWPHYALRAYGSLSRLSAAMARGLAPLPPPIRRFARAIASDTHGLPHYPAPIPHGKSDAMIETYILEQLAALQEHKTLSKVAEVLHISQPAISRSMQKLEDELGVKIFDRTKNRIVLNELGELAARHAQILLEAQKDMIRAVRDADRRSHTFSYGSIAPAPMWELTPIISQLYIGMTIAADLQETEDVLKRGLVNDNYQLIVLLHALDDKDNQGNPIYYSKPFIYKKLSVLLPKSHRLARRKSLYLKDLAGEKILIHTQIGFWYDVCCRKIPDAIYLEQNDLSTLSEIVNASDLPSFVTNMSDRLDVTATGKVAVPLVDDEVNVQFWCVCKAENRRAFTALFNAIGRIEG